MQPRDNGGLGLLGCRLHGAVQARTQDDRRCDRRHDGVAAWRRGRCPAALRRCGVAAWRRGSDAAASGSVAARRRCGAVARRRGGVAARWRGGADPEAVALECALPLLLKRWPRSLSGVRALSLGVH